VKCNGLVLASWDISGQDDIRGLQEMFRLSYYPNTKAIVFVVDSTDRHRIGDAAKGLRNLMVVDELKDVCLLVFANKQDLPHALTVSEVMEEMDLHALDQVWHISSLCALTGEGLVEGFDWLRSALNGDVTASMAGANVKSARR